MTGPTEARSHGAPKEARSRSAVQPDAAGARALRVAIDDKVYELRGLKRGGVDQLMRTMSRGAASGREAGAAEFTVRITRDGSVAVSAIRTEDPPLVGQGRAEVVTTRSEEAEAAFAAARERGRHRAAQILDRPEMVSAEAFGRLLGLSRVAVNDRRQKHEVLALEGAKRGFRYPDWQILDDGKPIEILPKLSELLGGPWAVYRFLVQSHSEFEGETPLEWIRSGRQQEVLALAEGVARGDFA